MTRATDPSSVVRVLVVINRIGAPGGAERSTLEIIEGLHGRGFHFAVFALWPDRDTSAHDESVVDHLAAAGVDEHIAPRGFGRRVTALRRVIRSLRPHVVHSVLFDADMASRAATAFSRTPNLCSLVSTQYGAAAMQVARSRWRLQVVRVLDAVTGRLFVRRFHAVSEAVKDHARTRLWFPGTRISVVHRGRAAERLGEPSPHRRRRVRQELGVPEGAPVLLTVGRQEPAKDHLTLVRAFSELLPAVPDAWLLLVGGEGSASSSIRSLIDELGLRERVRQLGVRADVGDLLVASDVFVLSSRWEGLPGAAIEALAVGTLIVASDIPAVRDVVGVNGLLVPAENAAALARAVAEVLGHPDEARARADSGRADFRNRFTATAMLDGMARLYRDTATRRRR